jgi:hypothetical protein
MSPRLRTLIGGVLAVAVILFVFRNYYGGNGLLFGDANFMWSPSLLHAELVQFLHVWRPAASGGTSGAIANESQNYVLFQALFAPLGIPLSTVLVFPFFLAIGAFSFYLFARTLNANRLGSLAGAAFFIANPWTCDQMLAGHVAILGAVCLSPLIFFAFLRLRQGEAAFGFLLFALCAVELALDPRTSIFVFAGILIAGILARSRSVLIFAVLAPLYAVVCNGAWTILYALNPYANLVPFFYPPVEDLSVFSWYSDFWHSLVMSAYFIHFSWTGADVWGAFTFVPWYAAVVLALVVPLLAASKRRLSYVLALPAIVLGVILSMGTRALPAAPVYWAYAHVPMLSLLREPVKFGYLTALGAAVLIALSMQRLRGLWRFVLSASVLAAIAPVFFGTLSVPEGYGFQEFAARPAYLRMLHFLEMKHVREDFRIAVFPPWLAEQSLVKGAFYTDNPFVFQSEIPVVDAKLINTANATAEQAWQAFYGIYSGTDAHPAATLGDFGVKYVVVPGGIRLSAAAAFTPFASADDALTAAILAGDRNFVSIYSDGQNRIFQNRLFKPIFRTARTPIIAGDIPAVLRQAMPAGTFGDSYDAGERAQALPDGAIALSDTPLGRCLDEHGELPTWNAYYKVTKHDDWLGYWTASDWVVSAPDNYRSRVLQRFPLPFAYTESRSAIRVRVDIARGGELYAQAATIGSAALLRARVDGKTSVFPLASDRLHWLDLGQLSGGSHDVAFTGSAAGTILRRVVVDSGSCASARNIAAPAHNMYFIPGPNRSVTINIGAQLTRVAVKPLALGGGADNPPAWSVATPPGAVAATWDFTPVTSGRPFPSLSGFSRLTFLAPAGQPLTGTWQASDAGKNLTLAGSRWPQRADVNVTQIPDGQSTLIDLSISGTLRGSQLQIGAPGGRTMSVAADSLRTPFLLIPYIGQTYTISLTTPANGSGRVSFGADVRVAAPAGKTQIFRIPSAAVATRAVHPASVPGTAIASYSLTADNNLQPMQFGTLGVPVNAAQGLVLHLRNLSANGAGRAVITAFYDSWANPAPMKFADIAVGKQPSSYDLAVPLAPFTETIAFSILPVDDPKLSLSLQSAQLSDSDPLAGGMLVSIPSMRTGGGSPVVANDSHIERIPFGNNRGTYLTGTFTYDPYWSIDAQPHWEVNGFANGWRAGSSGVMVYGLQALYRGLLIAGAVLWLAALAAFAFLQTRRRRARLLQDS